MMLRNIRKLAGSELGATAVEYGLILALVVLAMIGGLSLLGTKTNAMWTTVSNEVSKH